MRKLTALTGGLRAQAGRCLLAIELGFRLVLPELQMHCSHSCSLSLQIARRCGGQSVVAFFVYSLSRRQWLPHLLIPEWIRW